MLPLAISSLPPNIGAGDSGKEKEGALAISLVPLILIFLFRLLMDAGEDEALIWVILGPSQAVILAIPYNLDHRAFCAMAQGAVYFQPNQRSTDGLHQWQWAQDPVQGLNSTVYF